MDRLLTIEDVAHVLQMPERFVEQQIRLDYLPAVIIGTEVRIEASAVRRYIDDRKTLEPLRLRMVD